MFYYSFCDNKFLVYFLLFIGRSEGLRQTVVRVEMLRVQIQRHRHSHLQT